VPVVQGVVSRDGTISSFEEFAERWKHGLRKGQLKICEVLYQKTHAVGQTECVTSFSELGRLSGLKMRQCFNVIAQLEALRFVERSRSEATSNKKDQGSVIRFHLYPIQ
jgi:DNA-binding MarR family transcriptional regulator